LKKTPIWCQVLFFGALLSAILSTASGTLLAPSSLFTENVLQPFIKGMGDKTLLWTVRCVLAIFAIAATYVALTSNKTMYEMVKNAYKVTLVVAFVPLAFGVFWKRASTQGAMLSVLLGTATWLAMEKYNASGTELVADWGLPGFLDGMPPQIYGVLLSVVGMVVGSLLPQWLPQSHPEIESGEPRRSPIAGH
jgi:Na+/proline symporter